MNLKSWGLFQLGRDCSLMKLLMWWLFVFFFFFLLGGLGWGDKIRPLVVDSPVVFTSGYGRFFCPETCFIV